VIPRVYPILDRDILEARGLPLRAAAAALLDGGARILQLRNKGHWKREYFEEAKCIAAWRREREFLLIVNDRADMAMLLKTGLHLGQDDLAPTDARRLLGPDATIGYSTHNAEQLRAAAAEPVDYVALGPVFATASKSNPDAVVGVDRLRAWRALTARPLVAIGGITRDNAGAVFAAGADSVAVIADLFPAGSTEESLRERMKDFETADGRR
jgi:thiamine-phosphate pyrophosphorylase